MPEQPIFPFQLPTINGPEQISSILLQMDVILYIIKGEMQIETKPLPASYPRPNPPTLLTSQQTLIYKTSQELIIAPIGKPCPPTIMKINKNPIVEVTVSGDGLLVMLYANAVLQVRRLQDMSSTLAKFTQVEYDLDSAYPKIYIDGLDIYLLYEDKLQIISIAKKDRKLCSDIVVGQEEDYLQGLAISNLISKEKIVILEFSKKLTFNIIPIPITDFTLHKTGGIMLLTPILKQKIIVKEHEDMLLYREFLLVITNNCAVHIYNFINMKPIIQLEFNPHPEQRLVVLADQHNQVILITIWQDDQVVKNILYGINVQYYYKPTTQYFDDEQPFFSWEAELYIPYPISMISGEPNSTFKELTLCYYDTETHRIQLTTLCIPHDYKTDIKQSHIVKDPTWMELRSWKDIITSYIQMKHSLDRLDFQLDEYNSPDYDFSKQLKNITEKDFQKYSSQDEADNQLFHKESYEGAKLKLQNSVKYDDLEKISSENIDKYPSESLERILPFINLMDLYEQQGNESIFQLLKEQLQKQHLTTEPRLHPSKSQKDTRRKKGRRKAIKNQQKEKIKTQEKEEKNPNSSPTSLNHSKQMNLELGTTGSLPNQEESEQIKKRQIANEEFDHELELIEETIEKAFDPVNRKLDEISQTISKYESVHVRQLQNCVKLAKNHQQQAMNTRHTVQGYCKQLMTQFNESLSQGLEQYWLKIQQIDRKGAKERSKLLNQFGKHIDQEIRNRQNIFDSSRLVIENNLVHLRKTFSQPIDREQQEEEQVEQDGDQFWEDEQTLNRKFISYLSKK